MSTATYRPTLPGIRFDGMAVALVVLMLAVQVGGLMAAGYFQSDAAPDSLGEPNGQLNSAESGIGLATILVVESLILIGIWMVYKRFPELVKKAIKWTFRAAAVAGWIFVVVTAPRLRPLFVGLVGRIVADKLMERFDLDWILHNGLAFAISIAGAGWIGALITPTPLIVFLVLAALWDYSAVTLSSLMDRIVDFSSGVGIPNYFILPDRPQVNFEAIKEWIASDRDADKPPGLAGVIGVGDFVLPSALAVSAAQMFDTAIPMAGVMVGTAVAVLVLRESLDRSDDGLPALPWVNSGAIGGFLVGVMWLGAIGVVL